MTRATSTSTIEAVKPTLKGCSRLAMSPTASTAKRSPPRVWGVRPQWMPSVGWPVASRPSDGWPLARHFVWCNPGHDLRTHRVTPNVDGGTAHVHDSVDAQNDSNRIKRQRFNASPGKGCVDRADHNHHGDQARSRGFPRHPPPPRWR